MEVYILGNAGAINDVMKNTAIENNRHCAKVLRCIPPAKGLIEINIIIENKKNLILCRNKNIIIRNVILIVSPNIEFKA